jgi:hypothetical protein
VVVLQLVIHAGLQRRRAAKTWWEVRGPSSPVLPPAETGHEHTLGRVWVQAFAQNDLLDGESLGILDHD